MGGQSDMGATMEKKSAHADECLQSHLQTSPPTLQKSYQKFRNPRTTFENTPLSGQKCPQIVLGVETLKLL